jgi:Uma2 family endonuclease
MSPAPHLNHQEIMFNFARLLRDFVVSHRLGKVYVSPVNVVLTQRRVVQPDALFMALPRFKKR